MKLLIIGAGAIGSLLGGRLALAGCSITLVGREWLRDAVAAEGLTVVTDGEPATTHDVEVVTTLSQTEIDSFDLIVLAMKAYGVTAAVEQIADLTTTPPPILTLQNGVGCEDIVTQQFGVDRVIAGTLTTPAEMVTSGTVNTTDKGGIGLAPLDVYQPDPTELAEALETAGFKVRRYGNATGMKWTKLLLNMIGNATSAILAWPPEQTFDHPQLYDIELDALVEARKVMGKLGIRTVELPGYPVTPIMALLERLPRRLSRPLLRSRVAQSRGGKMPSLFLDLDAGRQQLEIDVLNGAVVAAGEKVAVPTPVNRALTTIVHNLATGRMGQQRFYHKPEALLAAVEQYS